MKSAASLAWRALEGALTRLPGELIVFEEWGWVPLGRLLGLFPRLPPIAWLERRIASLPPPLAMLVLLVPALLLLPVKLAALWWMGRGRALLGLAVIVSRDRRHRAPRPAVHADAAAAHADARGSRACTHAGPAGRSP
jgi:hypothetical protein